MLNLLDNFRETGDTYEGFKEAIKEISDATGNVRFYPTDFEILSAGVGERAGKEFLLCLNKEILEDFYRTLKLGSGYSVAITENNKELMEEMKSTTNLMVYVPFGSGAGDKFFVSDFAIPTLAQRASIMGTQTLTSNSIIRNMHFAEALCSKDAEKEGINFVYRKEGDQKKIFAAMGGSYSLIPQTILCDLIDLIDKESTLGELKVKRWAITHDLTGVQIDFPDAKVELKTSKGIEKDLTPGIALLNSDIGTSSIIIMSTYRKGKSIIIGNELAFKHTKMLNIAKMKEEIDNTILADIRKLPETLIDLIGKPLMDYSKVDVKSEGGKYTNRMFVEGVIDELLDSELKGSITGKKLNSLKECLHNEIVSDTCYTAFDIADIFLAIPERILGVDRYVKEKVAKACGRVPYSVLKAIDKVAKASEEKVVLV